MGVAGAGPVFVRGMSRSGGTLLVTLLDAHPDIAMSYELYPRMLEELDEQVNLSEVAQHLREVGKPFPDSWPGLFTRFLVRTARGGLTLDQVADVLQERVDRGGRLSTLDDGLRFVEGCAHVKMRAEGALRWGAKCSNAFTDYARLFPESKFLNIVRDGRDVLASQKHTGSFDADPARVGQAWSNVHSRFHACVESGAIQGMVVRYESLVRDPLPELSRICTFLGVPLAEEMLGFHDQSLSIFGATHLSMDRISQPIDGASIGRWRDDLSSDEVAAFWAVAGPTMEKFGYGDADPANDRTKEQ